LAIGEIEPILAPVRDVVHIDACAILLQVVEIGAFYTFVYVVVKDIAATWVLLANTIS
jgi:hypothetical protein